MTLTSVHRPLYLLSTASVAFTKTSAHRVCSLRLFSSSIPSSSRALDVLHQISNQVREQSPRQSLRSSYQSLHQVSTDLASSYEELPPVKSGSNDRVEILEQLLQPSGSAKNKNLASQLDNYLADPTNGTSLAVLRQSLPKSLYELLIPLLLESSTSSTLKFLLGAKLDVRHLATKQDKYQPFDAYLRRTLLTWCSPSILELRRLEYDTCSEALLQRLTQGEGVHPIRDPADLRHRMTTSNVYSLQHPLLDKAQDRPLVVIYSSLRHEVPNSIQCMLDPEHESIANKNRSKDLPTIAIFYTISNLESALSGTGLGEHLIRRVVPQLQSTDAPTTQRFMTLSPVPGFRAWLEKRPSLPDHVLSRLGELLSVTPDQVMKHLVDPFSLVDDNTPSVDFRALPPWFADAFSFLATYYLVYAKHAKATGHPLDPVARFHLGNGAGLYKIHPNSNMSPRGWQESYGFMVNYHYDMFDSEDCSHESVTYEMVDGVRVEARLMEGIP